MGLGVLVAITLSGTNPIHKSPLETLIKAEVAEACVVEGSTHVSLSAIWRAPALAVTSCTMAEDFRISFKATLNVQLVRVIY
jgi:hypothetical protein